MTSFKFLPAALNWSCSPKAETMTTPRTTGGARTTWYHRSASTMHGAVKTGRSPAFDVWTAPQTRHRDASTMTNTWEPLCDSLPPGVDYIVFNNNVLDGPVRSTILLQQCTGVLRPTMPGVRSRGKQSASMPTEPVPINRLHRSRPVSRAFYTELCDQPKYTKGFAAPGWRRSTGKLRLAIVAPEIQTGVITLGAANRKRAWACCNSSTGNRSSPSSAR